jgi:Alcohol dehydrogenase GroES-like domain
MVRPFTAEVDARGIADYRAHGLSRPPITESLTAEVYEPSAPSDAMPRILTRDRKLLQRCTRITPGIAIYCVGRSVLPQPLPVTPGSDLSGEIVILGPGVSDWRVGDQV